MNTALLSATDASPALPIWLVAESSLSNWLADQPQATRLWVTQHGFAAEKWRLLILPAESGLGIGAVVLGLGAGNLDSVGFWHGAATVDRLPASIYRLATPLSPSAASQFALGWAYGTYRFLRYRPTPATPAGASKLAAGRGEARGAATLESRLIVPTGVDLAYLRHAAGALGAARDWINSPPNDFGPAELAEAAQRTALEFQAECRLIVGEELIAANYPLIYEVGKGSPREPRLIDLRWGERHAPRVTLVGKGVCFDSGGLDIKPSAGMLLMKKDMGGAACVLALAQLLMAHNAPIRLRVLIPAVENSVDGKAYRPSDVLRSRAGLTIEVGNTDAEGRLVLADALTEADSERPALLVDVATLTGAARTALGPEIPPVYARPAQLGDDLRAAGDLEGDPVWPMPLWAGYDEELASRIADLNNVSSSPFAGSIIGGLFLQRFVVQTAQWLHLDIYAWNSKDRPGRPVGAEPQAVRALYRLIRQRFG